MEAERDGPSPGAPLIEAVLERAAGPAVGIDALGRITFWNAAAASMFDVASSEAIGAELIGLLVAPREQAAQTARLLALLRSEDHRGQPVVVDLPGRRPGAGEFPLELAVAQVRGADGAVFYGFLRDRGRHSHDEHEHARLVGELRRALHGSERRLDAIVGSLTDAVTVRDRDHRFVYANRAALEHLGFASWEELQASTPDRVMADYIVLGEDRRPISMQDIPSVRILRGEAAEPLVIETVHRITGEHRWDLLKSAPVHDENGDVEATIMIIEDITQRKRVEQRTDFLRQAGDVLASSLDPEQTLRNVAWLAVPTLADWCAVDLVDERGRRRPVAVAHVDPQRIKLAEELRTFEPEQPDTERGIGRVLATGESQLYPEVADEMLVAGAIDARHLELLREVGFSAAMIVPINLGDRTLGAMTLVSAESKRPLDEFDLDTARQAAARAAVAIENARLYSERSLIAHTLQQSLLPEQLPDVPGYDLASIYLPAVASTEVGGDFYDVWESSDGWMIAIGDVTGKGINAAALTGVVRHTLRVAAEFQSSPGQLLAWVDWALKKQPEMSLCTALCLRLRGDVATLAIGGHPLPLLISDDGVVPVGANGPLLGGFDNVGWKDSVVPLAPGSTLVAYTDGVTDAIGDDGTRYGPKRLRASLTGRPQRNAQEIIRELRSDLELFQPARRADDTAVLALHRRSCSEERPEP